MGTPRKTGRRERTRRTIENFHDLNGFGEVEVWRVMAVVTNVS